MNFYIIKKRDLKFLSLKYDKIIYLAISKFKLLKAAKLFINIQPHLNKNVPDLLFS